MFVTKSLKALKLFTNKEIFLVQDLWNNCIFHLFIATWTMQMLLEPALTKQIQFLFVVIKNMQSGLFMKKTVLHTQNLSLNMQKH